jgi:hypothetical protein
VPRATIAVVGCDTTLDRTVLPATSKYLNLGHEADAGRCFNEAIARFGRGKQYFVCAHRDLVPTWDIRAQLLKCLEHDFTSSAREVIDLTEDDSARVTSQQAHLNTDYATRPRRGLCAEGCVITKAALERSGGWDDSGGRSSKPPSLRHIAGLTLFDSPAVGMRLFAGDASIEGRGRLC